MDSDASRVMTWMQRVVTLVAIVGWCCLISPPAHATPTTTTNGLPDPHDVPGPIEGDYSGWTRDGGGQGTGGLDPITYMEDVSIAGWQSSTSGFTAAPVTMTYDLSTTMFPEAIRSQGDCNSCWAVTATEHFQAILVSTSVMTMPDGGHARLSAQEVIDCNTKNHGCHGGAVVYAFDFLSEHGVNLGFEYTYPLNGMQQSCAPVQPMPYQGGGITYKANPIVFLVAPCLTSECPPDVTKEQALLDFWANPQFKNVVTGEPALLPMMAYVNAAEGWNNFSGGLYDPSQCDSSGHSLSHVVQIVGFGTDNATGTKFWLIRNTWSVDSTDQTTTSPVTTIIAMNYVNGWLVLILVLDRFQFYLFFYLIRSSYWGEDGHIRLPFGVNACGLFNYVTYMPGAAASSPTSEARVTLQ